MVHTEMLFCVLYDLYRGKSSDRRLKSWTRKIKLEDYLASLSVKNQIYLT